jgi:glycosyltransferase involved in cell wall biosynthesis
MFLTAREVNSFKSNKIEASGVVRLQDGDRDYVLLTAAYNEEGRIATTIESVIAQTFRPNRWVIVSDCSTDRTDEIVQGYADRNSFIRLLRVIRPPGRSFGAKVRALHAGGALLQDVTFRFVGNLDADVTVEPKYFEELLQQFDARPHLGIAGGFVFEEVNGKFQSRPANRVYSVAHAAQLVRKECYDDIGGYAVLEYGGEDWHAQVSAGMKGWEVEAFPQLKIFHYRHTGEGDNLLRHKFRQGKMDYAFGSDPLFELLKCAKRFRERPFLLGSVARLTGFYQSWVAREKRPVSDEFVAFLRKEQRDKLASLLAGTDVSNSSE